MQVWGQYGHTESSIHQNANWLVSFPLHSAVQYVSATGLQPENIVFRLSLKLGGRLAHCEDGYRKIGISEGNIDIIKKGYQLTWIKSAPKQRVAACSSIISTKASNVFNTEVARLLEKGAIYEVAEFKEGMLVHTL